MQTVVGGNGEAADPRLRQVLQEILSAAFWTSGGAGKSLSILCISIASLELNNRPICFPQPRELETRTAYASSKPPSAKLAVYLPILFAVGIYCLGSFFALIISLVLLIAFHKRLESRELGLACYIAFF